MARTGLKWFDRLMEARLHRLPDDWDGDDDAAKRDARIQAEFETLTMQVDCRRCGTPVTVYIKDFMGTLNTDYWCSWCWPGEPGAWKGLHRRGMP